MKLNKEEFLTTKLGKELKECLTKWDEALEARRRYLEWTAEYQMENMVAVRCSIQYEVYQMALKQFYGIEYHFTRTDEYFGMVTEDESDWLFKVERNI